MKIEVGYGNAFQSVEIPEKNIIKVLHGKEIDRHHMGKDAVEVALNNPIGTPKIEDIVKPGEKIVIITSDITRPMPTWEVMPSLLDRLYSAGVNKEDITLVFACGSHRKHTPEEQRHLAGERAYKEIECMDSTPEDCVHMGDTNHGTPIEISRVVAEAQRRICLGNIEYHYFAGYSGGAKAIFPGVSTPAAIQSNHSMMVDSRACAGRLKDNPLRDDIEEGAAAVGADFIVNVVLDEHKNIIEAFAGDMVEAHRAGCKFLDTIYQVEIPEKADIVVVSQGGAPKDANLYQTQKALDNSKHAIKAGGTIVLVGSCNEGMGSAVCEEWMREAEKPEDLITRVRENFKLGGHKAAAIAMILEYANIKLVSHLEQDFVESIFMEPYDNLEEAYKAALEEQGENARVIVMPYGGSTLPIYKEK